MGLDDELWAYQFDAAVNWAGNYVEAKLTEYNDQGKPKYRLEDLLAAPDGERVPETRTYRDPVTGKLIEVKV